jgi:hypothetical protein
MRSGALDGIERIITHVLDLHEVHEGYRIIRQMRDQVIKVMVRMPPYENREESPVMIYESEQRELASTNGSNAAAPTSGPAND